MKISLEKIKEEIELKRKKNKQILKELKERSLIVNSEKHKKYCEDISTIFLNRKRKISNKENNIQIPNELKNYNNNEENFEDNYEDIMDNNTIRNKYFYNLFFSKPQRFSINALKKVKKKKFYIRTAEIFSIYNKNKLLDSSESILILENSKKEYVNNEIIEESFISNCITNSNSNLYFNNNENKEKFLEQNIDKNNNNKSILEMSFKNDNFFIETNRPNNTNNEEEKLFEEYPKTGPKIINIKRKDENNNININNNSQEDILHTPNNVKLFNIQHENSILEKSLLGKTESKLDNSITEKIVKKEKISLFNIQKSKEEDNNNKRNNEGNIINILGNINKDENNNEKKVLFKDNKAEYEDNNKTIKINIENKDNIINKEKNLLFGQTNEKKEIIKSNTDNNMTIFNSNNQNIKIDFFSQNNKGSLANQNNPFLKAASQNANNIPNIFNANSLPSNNNANNRNKINQTNNTQNLFNFPLSNNSKNIQNSNMFNNNDNQKQNSFCFGKDCGFSSNSGMDISFKFDSGNLFQNCKNPQENVNNNYIPQASNNNNNCNTFGLSFNNNSFLNSRNINNNFSLNSGNIFNNQKNYFSINKGSFGAGLQFNFGKK